MSNNISYYPASVLNISYLSFASTAFLVEIFILISHLCCHNCSQNSSKMNIFVIYYSMKSNSIKKLFNV
jgi:hypothetical protein